MSDATETHPYADDIVWAFLETLELEGVDDPDTQIGEWPGSDLDQKLPYIAVEVVDGPADYLESEPVVDIDVFAATRKGAKSIAAAIQLAFLRYPSGVNVAGTWVTIDRVVCTGLPVKREWDDPSIRRQSATYQLTVRR